MKNAIIFLVCFVQTLSHAAAINNQGDTVQIKTDLDSAWSLMQKRDASALPLLHRTLQRSRTENFRHGEGESLYTFGKYYFNLRQFETGRRYLDSALTSFVKSGLKSREAQCNLMIGITLYEENSFLESTRYLRQSSLLYKALGNNDGLANALTNLGLSYEKLGDYPKALDYYFQGLKIDEAAAYRAGIASDYGCIATVYGEMGESKKAYEFYDKAISESRALADDNTLGGVLTNYGILLKNNGEFDQAEKMHDEALAIYTKMNESRGICGVLHNIGSLYHARGKYNQALAYYDRSLKAMGDENKDVLQTNYQAIAEAYNKLKRYSQALTFAKKALVIEDNIKMLDDQVKTTKLISEIYNSMGDYKQSLSYFELHTLHKDSLDNIEKSRQFRDLQTKYETEKKEKEILTLKEQTELQEASLQTKTFIQYGLLGGFAVFLFFGFILIRNNRAKQDARRELLDEQLKFEKVEAERLKELDHLKSRFFANIAHEFRTPLTLILGPVENLIGELRNEGERTQLLLVKNNASRLVKLVNQLLDLSKLEAGAVKLEYVNEDIIHFLKANTFAFQSVADQKHITINFQSALTFLVMKFDRDKLEKIFSNLLSNAFKFTPSNGHVTIKTEISEKFIRVIVSDSGQGIPTDDLPYVFNRFYQSGKVSRSTTGSGIGLELTKELVEICGGEIGVANPNTGGAQFYFTLPIVTGETVILTVQQQLFMHTALASEDARTPVVMAHDDIPSETKPFILVIEDNDDVRDFIVSALQTEYKIITAVNGEEGIVHALEHVPDLIVTDVMMPVKDGLDVCRTLKDDERTSHIPIIMLTAKADVESKIEGLQTGADDYLAKPFHTKELLIRIQNLIHQRRRLQEKFGQNAVETETETEDHLPLREKLFITRLNELIESHLAEEEYSVEDLSRDMAMSRMQLHRKVKALTNTSTGLYFRSVRLAHAKRLLEEGLYTVSEVAYRVGFNSPTYFSTCFSEQYGFPPSQWNLQNA